MENWTLNTMLCVLSAPSTTVASNLSVCPLINKHLCLGYLRTQSSQNKGLIPSTNNEERHPGGFKKELYLMVQVPICGQIGVLSGAIRSSCFLLLIHQCLSLKLVPKVGLVCTHHLSSCCSLQKGRQDSPRNESAFCKIDT